MAENDDLFARWSRRKRAVADEVVEAAPVPEPPEPDEDEADEATILDRLGLPVPETLKAGDDFTGFMKAGVPQFLQKRALRVLWRSNPVLACVDGLNDYDDDFNSSELTQKVIATAYKVGRGFLRDDLPSVVTDDDTDESLTVAIAGGPNFGLPEQQHAVSGETEDNIEPDVVSGFERTQSETSPEKTEKPLQPRRMRFEI